MEQIPFCQRNVRLWVSLLIGAGALVLGFAIWLAFKRSQFDGSHHVTAALGLTDPHAAADDTATPAGSPAAASAATASGAAAANAALTPSLSPLNAAMQVGAVRAGTSPALQLQSAFNRAADAIRPSVVNINAIRPSLRQNAAPQNQGARFIDPFDGVPDKVFGNLAYESVGSGLIVDPRGYIVTNHHLVGQATAIMITRYNHANEHLPARVVASDPDRDLALLKLERAGRFPAASFADSSRVEVGDWVLAVGNPFGLGHTVTSGIISGRRPSMVIGGMEYRGLLQTDAPINQGSSGGPLVNLEGEVIGINTAIYAPTGVFNGTGFAIPSNRVSAFVTRALGREQPPAPAIAAARPLLAPATWLGLHVTDVTPQLAAKLSLAQAGGVFVNSVTVDSPAEEAEIRRGDVIVALAGLPVQDVSALQQINARLPSGQKVAVVVWRGGKPKTLKLKT